MTKKQEAAWQETVVQTARYRGWLVYHTYDSRKSDKGFPDLVLVRATRIIFAELKSPIGELEPEQIEWLSTLSVVALAAREQAEAILSEGIPVKPLVEAHVWRPADWDKIEALLR